MSPVPGNTHKAAPCERYGYCVRCGQHIKRVPGGQGPVWVHADSGDALAPNPPPPAPMSQQKFTELWVRLSTDVADELYPKGNEGRGMYLRDQAVLHSKILDELAAKGFVEWERT